ncbi:hypothetical protein MN116_008083 [Schistosoma mekongi]|uniref:Dyp-type peroxidase C-terminal domain-containing protein n=1 Tax=Schistosoma mekongi TaxID=38744 RepID=A0AAE1Z743_SCHME|nr:hypothetical protein MN116_008083 [Schistosoma mekongi]
MKPQSIYRQRLHKLARNAVVSGCIFNLLILFAAYIFYSNYKILKRNSFFAGAYIVEVIPQGSVITETKAHSLFLTIHLSRHAIPRQCLESIGHIERYVRSICPPETCQENEILYGVGFGFDFFKQINPNFESKGVRNFEYRERSGDLGKLPKTGGDIFVHAKCREYGKLFELTQAIVYNLPPGSVAEFEDVYGWVYRNGRDLSGFIDGTMNPKTREERAEVAIDGDTGGSYALVQKWIHNMEMLRKVDDETKEQWIGRTLENSFELRKKSVTSHIARMIGTTVSGISPRFRIVRQSQPFGTLSHEAGLLFLAYASNIINFEFMLNRMTGNSHDRQHDDIMHFSRCVTGNYYYFPNQIELNHLIKG